MRPSDIVVFDLGKVLVDFDYSIAARRIAARSRMAMDRVQSFLEQNPLLVQYECGLLTTPQFFAEIRRATGYSGTLEEFGDAFADIFTEIPEMIKLQARLRRNQVRTYILSNSNDLAISHIRARFPFFSGFDGYILSYEHGAMKPDARLYEVVERQTGRAKDEILYIDDRAENVAAGAARGWHTILQENPSRTLAAVAAAGFLNHARQAG
jgi:2-haloacid dehalogenase